MDKHPNTHNPILSRKLLEATVANCSVFVTKSKPEIYENVSTAGVKTWIIITDNVIDPQTGQILDDTVQMGREAV